MCRYRTYVTKSLQLLRAGAIANSKARRTTLMSTQAARMQKTQHGIIPAFEAIRDHGAFYAHQMDACYVDGEMVQPQAGGFYGGWVTSKVVGPFKGSVGTELW